MRHLRGGGEYITPNLCLIEDSYDVVLEPEVIKKIENHIIFKADEIYDDEGNNSMFRKYYFKSKYPVESDIIINATYSKLNIVNGKPQGYIYFTEIFYINKGNILSNEIMNNPTEYYNFNITPTEDNKYIYSII